MKNNQRVSMLKLEGFKNWNVWKFQMKVLLRGQGWLDIVEGRCVKHENHEEERNGLGK